MISPQDIDEVCRQCGRTACLIAKNRPSILIVDYKKRTGNTLKKRRAAIAARWGAEMATTDYVEERRGSSSAAWFYIPVLLILLLGAALSVGAFFASDPQLTILESIAAGFGGMAAMIVALFAAAIGVLLGLVGALIGVVAAGGAVAMTLFIVGSPIIAIILIVLLMRRPKSCPDPSAHE